MSQWVICCCPPPVHRERGAGGGQSRKWRLEKRGSGQSGPGRTVPAEQADPTLSGAEQEPGGGPAEGPHLSSVLCEDV